MNKNIFNFHNIISNKKGYNIVLTTVFYVVIITFITFSISSKNLLSVILCLFVIILSSLWGYCILFYYKDKNLLEWLTFGFTIGIAVSAVIDSVIVYYFEWNLKLIIFSTILLPLITLSVMICVTRTKATKQTHDTLIWHILLFIYFIISLFIYLVFKNVPFQDFNHYNYAWLFGHDFINRIVHVESLSRGLPLQSFFFYGEYLSYYWLAYILPALLHNINFIDLQIDEINIVTQFSYTLAATSCVVILARKLSNKKSIFIILILLCFFCYSYAGLLNFLLFIWKSLTKDSQLFFMHSNILNFSGVSHGFYRFFLVEPQGTLALAMVAMVMALNLEKKCWENQLIIGLLLGLLFGIEATNSIMLFAWYIFLSFYILFFEKKITINNIWLTAIPFMAAAVVISLLFLIHMYEFNTGRAALQLKLNNLSFYLAPFYFTFAYGPLFILGIFGLIHIFLSKRMPNNQEFSFVALLFFGVFFALFIQNPTEVHFGLLKAARILPIALVGLSAYFFTNIELTKRSKYVITILLLTSFPTFITDNRYAADVSDPSTYLRVSDAEATKWIRENLPANAIVQAYPNYPGVEGHLEPKYAYSLIPIFAHRFTAVGEWKVSHQEHSNGTEVEERFHNIIEIFSTTDLDKCITLIDKYNIDYVYIGKLERTLFPDGLFKFSNTFYFNKIYTSKDVNIYEYKFNHL